MPIQQFMQLVKNADSSRSKEVKLDITQAKNLAFTLGIVMSRLEGDLETFVKNHAGSSLEDIEIQIGSGGDWK
jgi:hypothetical protein